MPINSTLLSKIIFVFILCLAFIPKTFAKTDIEQLQEHVKYLASDRLCGRLPTSAGEKRAASYIKKQFRQYGLEQLPSLDSYYHREAIPTNKVRKKKSTNITIDNKKAINLSSGAFSVLNLRYRVEFEGKIYPITDRALFTETSSLAGSVVILDISDTPFFDQFPDTGFMQLLTLAAEQAQKRNAEALLVSMRNPQFTGNGSASTKHIKQRQLEFINSWLGELTIPIAMIKQEVWDEIQEKAGSKNITIKHNSKYQIDYDDYTNVVGVIKGKSDKSIVIGAHFDHLGAQAKSLLSCSKIYNGADDNASGTSVLVHLAKQFAEAENTPEHNLIFAAFSAEELGLIGSKALAKHLELSGVKVEAMVNFDMLGHPDRPVEVKGTELSPDWDKWFKNNTVTDDLTTFDVAGFYPRSDHGSFIEHGIPSIIFSTGVHSRYHKTTDEYVNINFDGMLSILNKGASFIRYVDQQNSIDYIPQMRADITQWKIGEFDVISNIYNGSILNKQLPPFRSSPNTMFEWDLGMSGPPRKTTLNVSKISDSELSIKINRFKDFETINESEQKITAGEKVTISLPLDTGDIEVEVTAIAQ